MIKLFSNLSTGTVDTSVADILTVISSLSIINFLGCEKMTEIILLIFWTFFLWCNFPEKKVPNLHIYFSPTVCNLAAIDLVFLLDASGSIGSVNFRNTLNLVAEIVSGLEIGPDEGQVAVIRFGDTASLIFGLTAHDNQADLLTAINNIRYTGGQTNTAGALNLLLSDGFIGARPEVQGIPRVAIVVTDGRSSFRAGTITAAASVHAAQPTITVFAAGIRNFDRTELDVIASSPSSRFVITIPNFNSEAVERLRQALLQETCQGICSNGVLD